MLIQSRLDGHIDPNSDVQGSAGRAARTARIPGKIKFKADLDGLDLSGYGMFLQIKCFPHIISGPARENIGINHI